MHKNGHSRRLLLKIYKPTGAACSQVAYMASSLPVVVVVTKLKWVCSNVYDENTHRPMHRVSPELAYLFYACASKAAGSAFIHA